MACECDNECGGRVYRGETVIGDFTLYDDDGVVITAVDDAVLLLTDREGKAEPVVLRLGDGIEFSQGNFRFVLTPEQTSTLPRDTGVEVKIKVNGMTRIAASGLFRLVDNKVKDY